MARSVSAVMRAELLRLQEREQGLLKLATIVKSARSKKSPLHDWFEWRDGPAAEKYRLIQAAMLVRVVVEVVIDEQPPVRTFVSLLSDRIPSGGYRHVKVVLEDARQRAELLAMALSELRIFQRKYKVLSALVRAIEQVIEGHEE